MPAHPFRPFLERQSFVLLDGGLATALEAAGHSLATELWSARLVLHAPDAVRAVHTAYLGAGADCITTAGYQASLDGFSRAGLAPAEAEAALRRPVELAVEARETFWSNPRHRTGRLRPLVAASAGPFGAFLADGSEYEGRYGVARARLADFHGQGIEILAGTEADLLAFETIPSLEEAEVVAGLLSEVPHPGAWISFSCRDGEHLHDGNRLADAVRACAAAPGIIGVGVNCTHPRFVSSLVSRIREATDLPILAYPNSGEVYDPVRGAWTGERADSAWLAGVPDWIAAGASVIGGCCRVGPAVIRELRRLLDADFAPQRRPTGRRED